ncbi:MAG: flagellar hook capping FlgD N-terminal domain-containing protein [Pirellulaceae bacterium]|nr:flagellar hook capping FlgD N-terminal domain-containing protein [Pirellulaceae bacterium]
MSQIQNALATSSATSTASSTSATTSDQRGGGLQDLGLDQFLKLIITQLQNQDPLAPTDNAALMEQVGQLRSLSANDKLTSTLTTFSITQELTTASSLIGKKIDGIDDTGSKIDGVVGSVSVKIDEKDRNKRQVKVHVGDKTVDIKNVRQIVEATASKTDV